MPPVGLLMKPAEAGQIREVDAPAQHKNRLKQLPHEEALPNFNLPVVNVGYLPENSGYQRREKRSSKLRM